MDLAGTQETLVLDLAGPQEMDLVGCQQETPPMDLVLGDRPVPDLVGLVDLVGQYIWNFDAGTPGPGVPGRKFWITWSLISIPQE